MSESQFYTWLGGVADNQFFAWLGGVAENQFLLVRWGWPETSSVPGQEGDPVLCLGPVLCLVGVWADHLLSAPAEEVVPVLPWPGNVSR